MEKLKHKPPKHTGIKHLADRTNIKDSFPDESDKSR
jgi:hypothetical protein